MCSVKISIPLIPSGSRLEQVHDEDPAGNQLTCFDLEKWSLNASGDSSSVERLALLSSGWLCGPAVEHWSLAGVLLLSCARPVADG